LTENYLRFSELVSVIMSRSRYTRRGSSGEDAAIMGELLQIPLIKKIGINGIRFGKEYHLQNISNTTGFLN
jgi:hypothetical protein